MVEPARLTVQSELVLRVDGALARLRGSQVELARRAGVSEKHLSQMLNQSVEGSLGMWQRLLDVLDEWRRERDEASR